MSIAFDLFGMSCFVRIPNAVVLSNSKGVAGCGWPISHSIIRSSTPILALTYAPAISDSEAAPITFRRMLHSTCIGALMNKRCCVNGFDESGLFPKKWYPPTLLRALDTDRNEESEEIHRHISDALNVMEGFGYVAK